MSNKMDEGYFDEKKEFARKSLGQAVSEINDSIALIKSMEYTNSGMIDSSTVHESLEFAELLVRNARRDYEKASWASANTQLEFNEWLQERNLRELIVDG